MSSGQVGVSNTATSPRRPKRWTKVVLIVSGVAVAAAIGVIVYLRYFYGKDAPPPFELSSIAVVIPRRRRHRRAGITLALVVAAACVANPAAQAAAKAPAAGVSCLKAGATTTTAGGTTLNCRLAGKKKRWTVLPSSAPITVAANKTTVAPTNAQPAAAAVDSAIEGTYNIGAGSAGGYRVREIFVGGLAKVDAVGRSDAVTGSVVVGRNGKVIQLQSVTAAIDTTKLKSDETRRDNQMKSIGLETSKFPTATFTSSTSVSLDAADSGQPVTATVPGKLTLHGVTRDVQVGVDAQLRSGTMEVVGRVAIAMRDYGIDPPEIADFVKADADGVLEFKLVLKKA